MGPNQPQATEAHAGTPPAAAMITPFPNPCGADSIVENSECAPPEFDQYWWSSVGYYSPAICPSGYTVGCLRWNSEQGPPVDPTETAAQCVPSGYACDTKHLSMAYSYSQTAPMIQVRWAETDMSKFATHPLHPGAKPTARTTTRPRFRPVNAKKTIHHRQAISADLGGSGGLTEIPKGTPRPFDSTSPSDDGDGGGGGLSTGAKAGIGVGVSLGVLILLGLGVFFLWMHRKKNRPNNAHTGHLPPNAGPGMTETPTVVPSELDGPSPPPPAVLGMSRSGRAELAHKEATSPSGTKSELGGNTPQSAVTELHGQVPSPYSELHAQNVPPYNELHGHDTSLYGQNIAEPRRYELDGQQASSAISRKQVGSFPQQSISGSSPDHGVTVMPESQTSAATPPPMVSQSPFVSSVSTEPSPQELNSLRDQHAQLEGRRQRLLELENIEREQAALQQRMDSMRGHNM